MTDRGARSVHATGGAQPPPEALPYRILIADRDPAQIEALVAALGSEHRVLQAGSGEEALRILGDREIAILVVGDPAGEIGTAELLERASRSRPRAIRLAVAHRVDAAWLGRALDDGLVYRAIGEPREADALRLDARRALAAYELAEENARLGEALRELRERQLAPGAIQRAAAAGPTALDRIVGSSAAMRRVLEVVEKVAATDATVLISGEPGTGKRLVARAIHETGPRRDRPFAAQSCAALPDTLLESALFGHRRGAFTGAHSDQDGLFAHAAGGTIFLDEIGETHPGMQVRLLRVLQDGEIRPLGSSETRKVDVRLVAASSRDLRADVERGRFREDLYYRLRVVEIALPPLRERREDIPLLAQHFLGEASRKLERRVVGFSASAMDLLMAHSWSGNVRELAQELERAVVMAGDADSIGAEMLSEQLGAARPGGGAGSAHAPTLGQAVDDLKRRMIRDALREGGSKTRAAERLGIPRQSLQKMIKRLGIDA